jgi:hypothetical protein
MVCSVDSTGLNPVTGVTGRPVILIAHDNCKWCDYLACARYEMMEVTVKRPQSRTWLQVQGPVSSCSSTGVNAPKYNCCCRESYGGFLFSPGKHLPYPAVLALCMAVIGSYVDTYLCR